MPLMPVTEVTRAGGVVAFYDSTLGVDTANFDVPIPAIYKKIEWDLSGRGSTAAAEIDIRLRMNGDSGNNYEFQRHFSHTGNNNNGTDGAGVSSIFAGEFPAASASAGRVGSCTGRIHNYTGTVFNKLVVAHGGRVASIHLEEVISGAWLSTAAVTQLLFFPSAGSFLAGTRLTIWGVS